MITYVTFLQHSSPSIGLSLTQVPLSERYVNIDEIQNSHTQPKFSTSITKFT